MNHVNVSCVSIQGLHPSGAAFEGCPISKAPLKAADECERNEGSSEWIQPNRTA